MRRKKKQKIHMQQFHYALAVYVQREKKFDEIMKPR